MKNLAIALIACTQAIACAADTEPEIEALADDPELAADVYEVTRASEIETASLSATGQRQRVGEQLVSSGVVTSDELAAIAAVYAGERSPAELASRVFASLDDASPVVAVMAAAIRDATRTRPDLDPLDVISVAMRAAARGAVGGREAGGKRGAAFAALIAVQGALVSHLAN